MDDLLQAFLSFPPCPPPAAPISDQQYDEGIRLQVENLKKVPVKNLLQMTSSGEHILNVINPALNTVPYMFILLANINAFQKKIGNPLSGEILWEKMTTFVSSFDPRQIRYLGREFGEVIAALVEFSRRMAQPALAVHIISTVILRVDQSASTLTSNHLLLVRLSLEAEFYTAATPVIDRPILYFPGGTQQPKPKYLCAVDLAGYSYITPDSGLTQKLRYQDVLEYFMFSGTIYIALQQWERALDVLESAVTYPVRDGAVSKIMVEAYKKWVLVSVLLQGKNRSLPRTTNNQAAKLFHAIAKPYDVVANLFESASASRLYAEVHCGHEIWREDRNTGLMMLVLASYQKFQIRNLANVYCTISISEVTRLTVSAETGETLLSDQATETLIAHMIESGELHGTIVRPADSLVVLTFSSASPVLSESEVQRRLALSLRQIKSMKDDIRRTDRQLTRDREYLKWAHKNKKLGKNGRGDSISGEDMIWNPTEDEDLMGGSY